MNENRVEKYIKLDRKTKRIELAYQRYMANKTNENIILWFKVLRGEEIGKEIH